MHPENIVLLGFMGTGKSAVGRMLAKRLGSDWHFIEMDKRIEELAGLSISEIFPQEGESHFRDLETQVCRELIGEHHAIVSTGGGVVTRPENVEILGSFAHLILLTATPEVIFERIIKDGKEKRPLLAKPDPMGEIEKLLAVREELYRAATGDYVDTTIKSPSEVAEEILALLRENGDVTC
ncbi:MAG TPA: shikimate kinase [Candidatus Lokiarchaeia archaeon]|nr:shikimate kinase [Candidatus Lokiarchaeia archaeon]